jgi:hypothetical protein
MADVVGVRHTGNITQSIRKVDMVPTIKELEPSETPLTVFTTMMPSADAINPEFSWVEDQLSPRFDAVNNGAGYASGATSIVVDNGTYYRAGDLWKITRTGEIMRITSIATNTLTVVRGIGGGAAAIVDNDELMRIGSSHAENALSGTPTTPNPTKVLNYTQITRDWVESSETLRASEEFTRPGDWERQVAKKMMEHKIKLETTYLHGKPTEDVTGAPIRTTGGAFHFVQTNRTDVGGTMTETEMFGAFSGGFRYGNKQAKVGFASRTFVDVANTFPRGKLELVQADNDKTYGLDVMNYRSPHGTLKLVTHNLLEGTAYNGYCLVLDMSQLRKRPLKGRDTHINEHIEAPDQDGRKDEILTEAGLEFGLEKTHFIISNALA